MWLMAPSGYKEFSIKLLTSKKKTKQTNKQKQKQKKIKNKKHKKKIKHQKYYTITK